MEVRGYKVFNPDWTCSPNGNTKQYTCPGKFEENVSVIMCGSGMHFCVNAADCFNYYNFDPGNKVAEVLAYGDVASDGTKSCTNKLEIIREVPWQELLEIVNTGKGCTGLCNSGNRNSGDRNSGDRNSGDRNSGDWNSGDRNSGNWNSGNRNSGDWNSTNFSSGCFNTEEQKIYLFNKPSDWTYRDWINSDARYLLNQIPRNVVEWIYSSDMTDEEKEAHPEHKTTGGYLKVLDETDCAQIWWDGLSEYKKRIIMQIPNFDRKIFSKITGIKLEREGK